MRSRTQVLLIGELLFIALPISLYLALLVTVQFVAYPLANWHGFQWLFDSGVLLATISTVSAWFLGSGYLIHGREWLKQRHGGWWYSLAAASVMCLIAGVVGLEQMNTHGEPADRVGFVLLAPFAALLLMYLHLRALRQP